MQKYLLIMLLSSSLVRGMDQESGTVVREAREWDAQAYADGNTLQETAARRFLDESGLDVIGKKVLDVGCGTGNVSNIIAEFAKRVRGIDASKQMIEYAQATYGRENLSFEHCFAEDFVTQKKFNRAVCFFCLHWIKDKDQSLGKVNKALDIQGEFFGTHMSTSDPEPIHFSVLKKIFPRITALYSWLKGMDISQATDYNLTSDEEFKSLLTRNGFEIISYEQKSFDIVMSKERLENALRPVIMSRPFMKNVPNLVKNWFFDYLVEECLATLTPQDNGEYVIAANTWGTKVFHARKIAEI